MNLVDHFVGKHLDSPRRDAVAYVDSALGNVSYTELFTAAGAFAALLAEAGVARGCRGLVLADDAVTTVVAILGLWWHGCAAVPVNPALSDTDIGFIATDSGVAFGYLDVPARRRDAVTAVLPDTARLDGDRLRELILRQRDSATVPEPPPQARWSPDREALLQYTSGSTGVPKGVPHRAGALLSVPAGFGRVAALTPADVVLSTAKLSFAYGFGNSLLLPLSAGATTVLIDGAVDAQIVATALHRHRPTVLFSVPRLYAGLADSFDARDSRLRLAVSAGEALPADLCERTMRRLGVPLVNSLGTTELLYIVVATTPADPAPGTLGVPVPGVTATLRDRDGRILDDDLPDGEEVEGRLHIACASVAGRYLDRPDATRETFADGGAYTGDIVRRARGGPIRYLGRADDFLNLGGYKVSPAEIEVVIRAVAGVGDCAVVGIEDDHGLQQAVAFVVPQRDHEPGAVRRAVMTSLRGDLASFKRPGRVEMVDALPTTWTGKLARNRLRTIGAS
ncbi:AMP-binding protein [Nocardia sp. BMG111209]|uniref:AMP-binding protein n=1 Tax=Nocardia sp. BMG111209 TaxID=1160137 RepID=UPI000372155B|nr:AMP-binding protein [Nocardia sp. BMG111209]